MPDWAKIVLTALVTVPVGVVTFVVGQVLQRIFIEPIQEVRRTVGKIAHALTLYANFSVAFGKPPEQIEEVSLEIRRLAADLRSLPFVVPRYGAFAALGFVPKREAIDKASQNLIGWSNSLGGESLSHRKEIAAALKLSIPGLFP